MNATPRGFQVLVRGPRPLALAMLLLSIGGCVLIQVTPEARQRTDDPGQIGACPVEGLADEALADADALAPVDSATPELSATIDAPTVGEDPHPHR